MNPQKSWLFLIWLVSTFCLLAFTSKKGELTILKFEKKPALATEHKEWSVSSETWQVWAIFDIHTTGI